ncbi:MAG: lipopolysaccharide transport periplasmic protein LptA [Alphaproteobacteria bacterium]|nr:lipopolysaccharide transport periplasmic protein LptA [Alphaproteobacteria bacterium]MDD9919836.1 lipopolysaccharide transport periplasmic protein LptA [Alphaproteobacteria bacterium]
MKTTLGTWTLRLASAMLAFTVTTWAEEPLPLDIEANQMVMAFDDQNAVFSGNVSIKQGDITLLCETLTLQQGEDGSLAEVIATNNVRLTRGTETASGNKATYLPNTQMLVLKGNVTLQRGSSTLKGETLHYNLADGTLKIQNGAQGQRVRANLKPEDMNGKPQEKITE